MPKPPRDEDLFKDSTMTFGEHLEELRTCLFRAVGGLLVGVIVGLSIGGPVVKFIQSPLSEALTEYYQEDAREKVAALLLETPDGRQLSEEDPPAFKKRVEAIACREGLLPEVLYLDRQQVQAWLRQPPGDGQGVPLAAEEPGDPRYKDLVRVLAYRATEDDPRVHSRTLNQHEAFMIWLKASLVVGIVLASPWIFYQIWNFVAAGLYPHEKKYVNVYLPFSLALFLSGVSLAFFVVFKLVLAFLLSYNKSLGMVPEPRISEWMSFVLLVPLGFGIAFQLPLVMLFLERLGLLTVRQYLAYWRVAIMVIFVIAAIVTPADPYSMLLLAVPLTFLYFGGVLLCRIMPRGKGGLFAALRGEEQSNP